MNIDKIVRQYAANKAEADRLTALNADLAEEMLKAAVFKGASDTGHLTAGGYKVAITKRINEKWDQGQLQAIHKRMGDPFLGIFKQKFEPDRKALRVFFAACADESVKKQLRAACTATPGKPAVKLEAAS
jgi:hypothetical protein